jgi:hypothetical protein
MSASNQPERSESVAWSDRLSEAEWDRLNDEFHASSNPTIGLQFIVDNGLQDEWQQYEHDAFVEWLDKRAEPLEAAAPASEKEI